MEAFESMDKAGMKSFTLNDKGEIFASEWTHANATHTIMIQPEDDELIDALYAWCADVIEKRKNPLAMKRDAFAQKLYGCSYGSLIGDRRTLIDQLIEID